MNKIKIALTAIMFFIVFFASQTYATTHYEILTTSSVIKQVLKDYNQTGNGGFFLITSSGTLSISSATMRNNSATGSGGAISNAGKLIFGYNVLLSSNSAASNGGVIYSIAGSTTTIGTKIHFSSNTAGSSGGAIYNQGLLTLEDDILFSSNTSVSLGGAVYTSSTTEIGDDVAFHFNRSTNSSGGALYATNSLLIGNRAEFVSNQANSNGGALYASSSTIIGGNAVFSSNSSNANGGAIYSSGNLTLGNNVLFGSNTAGASGGAVYNTGTLTFEDGASFVSNHASGSGGAVYNSGVLNLIADSSDIIFENNSAGLLSNAVHNNAGTINLYSRGAAIIFNDAITSENTSGTININNSSGTQTSSGRVILNADMSGYRGTVKIYGGSVVLGSSGTFFNCSTSLLSDGVVLNFKNFKTQQHNFGVLTLNSLNVVDMYIDADLSAGVADSVYAGNSSTVNGTINVKEINLLTDSISDYTIINFTSSSVLRNKINVVEKTYSPLYIYDVSYSSSSGDLTFLRSSFNPTIFETSVAGLAGGYLTQAAIGRQIFANVDSAFFDRQDVPAQNPVLYESADSENSVFEIKNVLGGNLWIKPYSVCEKIDFDGTNVDNDAYGSLLGADFEITENKKFSIYAAYTASNQKYQDITMEQNGYVVGASGFFRKENFYAAITANMGFADTKAKNILSTDNFSSEMYSAAIKTGYGIELGSMVILQPSLFFMYGSIQTDEVLTSYGAVIKSKDLNNLHVEPEIKINFPLGSGWQPYCLASVVFNTAKMSVSADDLSLKEVGISNYVNYGVGLEKNGLGNFGIYLQALGKSGQVQGSVFSAGIKYSF